MVLRTNNYLVWGTFAMPLVVFRLWGEPFSIHGRYSLKHYNPGPMAFFFVEGYILGYWLFYLWVLWLFFVWIIALDTITFFIRGCYSIGHYDLFLLGYYSVEHYNLFFMDIIALGVIAFFSAGILALSNLFIFFMGTIALSTMVFSSWHYGLFCGTRTT